MTISISLLLLYHIIMVRYKKSIGAKAQSANIMRFRFHNV